MVYLLLRVGPGKYLAGGLPEVDDLGFNARPLDWVGDGGQIDAVFVGEVEVQVDVLLCDFTLLLVPEYEVDPVVDGCAHFVTFEGSPMIGNERVGVLAPKRELYVVDSLFELGEAEIVVFDVDEELGKVIKLWQQFPHI